MLGKSKVVSLSIDEGLLSRFDQWVKRKEYQSRSHAFQALVRETLDQREIQEGSGPAVATVTYVYDHHRRELMERIAHLQHEHLPIVVATTHVHLDHARCLEVLILRGAADEVRALGEKIIATKGVERGEMTITSALSPDEGHGHAHEHEGGHAHAHAHAHESAHAHEDEHEHEDGEGHASRGPAWHAAAHGARPRRAPRKPRDT